MSIETIKLSETFSEIYKKGASWHTPAFVCFYLPDEIRLVGVVASKKVGNAVYRNRAKRILRELARIELQENGRFVLVAKTPLLTTDFNQLREQIKKAFRHIMRRDN